MQLFLDEDTISGDIIICDRAGSEVIRFEGETAMREALQWANRQGLTVYSTLDPDDVHERHRSVIRRRLRLLRVRSVRSRPVRSSDPPNVQRVIVDDSDFEEFFGEEVAIGEDPFFPDTDVELTPKQSPEEK